MKKWPVLLLMICGLLIGLWLRGFFPKEIVNTVVKREVDQLPPEVIEKVLTDTVRVTKWKTKIVEKIKYREAIPETVLVYKEKVLPERFKALISHLEFHKPHLRCYLYSLQDSTITLFTHNVRNDFEVSIDQVHGLPRVKEARNFFDFPDLEMGWLSHTGFYIESELRISRFYPKARVNQEGVQYGVSVRHEF